MKEFIAKCRGEQISEWYYQNEVRTVTLTRGNKRRYTYVCLKKFRQTSQMLARMGKKGCSHYGKQ